MNLQRYEKAWAEFVKFMKTYNKGWTEVGVNFFLKHQRFEEISGILLKFLDERGIYVLIGTQGNGFKSYINIDTNTIGNSNFLNVEDWDEHIFTDSRTEATQEAIEKGFEILNQQLSKE